MNLREVKAETFGLFRHSDFHYVIEASTFGLKPGQVPVTIATDMGNKQPFGLISLNEERAEYRQTYGIIKLTVLND